MFSFCLLCKPTSSRRPSSSTSEVYQWVMLGHKSRTKKTLRHFVHHFPYFYRREGTRSQKVRNLASIFDELPLKRCNFEMKQHRRSKKCKESVDDYCKYLRGYFARPFVSFYRKVSKVHNLAFEALRFETKQYIGHLNKFRKRL